MVKLFPWKTMNPIGGLLYDDIRGNAFGRRCNWKRSSLIVMAGAKVPSMMPYRQLVLWYLLSRVVLRSLEKRMRHQMEEMSPPARKWLPQL